MMADIPTVQILGVPIAHLPREEAVKAVERAADEHGPALVAYVNAHTLNLAAADPVYRDVLRRAALLLNDGSGVAIAGRLYGKPFAHNLNGTDFTPLVLEIAARRGWSVYFLGSRPGVAERAAAILTEQVPGLVIAGVREGFFRPPEEPAIVEEIRRAGADVIVVALGNPRQEMWLDRNLAATGARLGIGVGAFFDFTAGVLPRAPHWMARVGLEWVWRLLREPARLWRRYVLGNPMFLWRLGREWLATVRRGRSRRHAR